MVSTVSYRSIKKAKLRAAPFQVPLFLGPILALIWYKPREGLLFLVGVYVLSGPLFSYITLRRRKNNGNEVAVSVDIPEKMDPT